MAASSARALGARFTTDRSANEPADEPFRLPEKSRAHRDRPPTSPVVEGAAARGIWALHAGVSGGYMVRRGGDYYGAAVNVAARVAEQAGPGEVFVTREMVDEWTGGPAVQFTELGEFPLKNVATPMSLFRAEWSPVPVTAPVAR